METEWVIEDLYFGNANYPSSATYRRAGDRIQVQVLKQIFLSPEERENSHMLIGSMEGVQAFMLTYEDCSFMVAPGYKILDAYGGGMTDPILWLQGWRELNTAEDFARYEEDKEIAM